MNEKSPSIKGKLSNAVHPAKLVTGFFKAHKSGRLHFRDGITEINIFLKKGNIVFLSESVLPSAEFGQYLVSKNVLSLKELMSFRQRAIEEKRPIQEIIQQEKLLEFSTLASFAQQYYWETTPMFFSWRHGEYAFFEHDIDVPEDAGNPLKTADYILQGIKNHYLAQGIFERLQKRLDVPMKFITTSPIEIKEIARLPYLPSILKLIRDGRTIRQITAVLPGNKADAPPLIYGLLTMEVVKFALPEERKAVIMAEKKLKKSASPLDRAFADALKSVERIRVETANAPKEEEIAILAEENDITALDNVETELNRKIKKLLDIKRQKIAIVEERVKGHRQTVSPDVQTVAEPPTEIMESRQDPEELAGHPDLQSFAAQLKEAETMIADMEGVPEDTLPPPDDADTLLEEIPESPSEPPAEEYTFDSQEFDLDLKSDSTVPPDGGSDPTFHEINPEDQVMDGFNDYLGESGGKVSFGPEESIEAIMKSMRGYCDEKRWEEADCAFNELVFREYDGADALALGGWIKYHLPGDDPFAAGAGLIQKAIAKSAKIDLPFLLMGKIYLEENDRNMAELYLVRAVEMNPDCFEAKELIKTLYQAR